MKQLISLEFKLVFHHLFLHPGTLNVLHELPYLFFVFVNAFLGFLSLESLHFILHLPELLSELVYVLSLLFKVTL
jgi:hypothetical protein